MPLQRHCTATNSTDPVSNTSKPRSNGHAAPNGADVASSVRGRAASVDASELSVANATVSSAAAGTDRHACAAVAHAPNGRPKGRTNGTSKRRKRKPKDHLDKSAPKTPKRRRVPRGKKPLAKDAGEFVEAIHAKIDLTAVWRDLLRSEDEKVKQRSLEKITELRYKGAASLADEPHQIVIDIDSAVARRAAQGAKK